MFNPNNLPNIWPSITPLLGQQSNQIQFGLFNNNQTLSQNNYSQQMPINSSVLSSNQQNINQLMSYYNQNQGFGQHLTPFANNYNIYRPQLEQQMSQTNSSSFMFQNQFQALSQPNIGFNPLLQSYPSMAQKPTQTLVSPQMQINSNQTISNTNIDITNASNEWLNLLNPSQKSVLEVLNKEQEEFELQFKNWEKEFENWKEANRSHPDKNAYHLYVIQWQEWRQKLVTRKQQMKELHSRTLSQLYSQVQQQQQQQPLPPEPSLPPPPPPSSPPKPLPLPPESQPTVSQGNSFPSTLLSPNKTLQRKQNSIQSNKDINNCTEVNKDSINKLNFNSSTSNAVQNKDLNNSIQTNLGFLKPQEINDSNINDYENQSKEIDCETKSVCDFDSKNDSSIVSKAAETILFIQKQQNLLKTLDSFKKVNQFSGDIEIIDGPKPFDINEIVTKMKAIRPPENPSETNQILSQIPSLQGIVFNKNSNVNQNNNYVNRRQQHVNSTNQAFYRPPHEPYQRFQNNYSNPMPAPEYRMQQMRAHRLPTESNDNFQRPQFQNSNNHQFLSRMPFDSVDNNRCMDSRTNVPPQR